MYNYSYLTTAISPCSALNSFCSQRHSYLSLSSSSPNPCPSNSRSKMPTPVPAPSPPVLLIPDCSFPQSKLHLDNTKEAFNLPPYETVTAAFAFQAQSGAIPIPPFQPHSFLTRVVRQEFADAVNRIVVEILGKDVVDRILAQTGEWEVGGKKAKGALWCYFCRE